jgi:hypothetical protein
LQQKQRQNHRQEAVPSCCSAEQAKDRPASAAHSHTVKLKRKTILPRRKNSCRHFDDDLSAAHEDENEQKNQTGTLPLLRRQHHRDSKSYKNTTIKASITSN